MTNVFVAKNQFSGQFSCLEAKSLPFPSLRDLRANYPFVDDLQLLTNVRHFAVVLHGIGFELPSFGNGPMSQGRRFRQPLFRIVQFQLGGLAALLTLQEKKVNFALPWTRRNLRDRERHEALRSPRASKLSKERRARERRRRESSLPKRFSEALRSSRVAAWVVCSSISRSCASLMFA